MSELQSSSTGPAAKYTAVVYFHGMGSQRHYEELCLLVDRLDQAVYERSRAPGTAYDGLRLHGRSARVERSRDPALAQQGRDVVYVVARAVDEHQERGSQTLRFYEAYWAPETVDGTSAMAVALWLFGEALKPLMILFGPWREYRRLRRATLVAMYQRRRDRGEEDAANLRDRTARLVGLYEQFQGPSARGRFRGSFAEFERFIEHELRNGERAEQATAEVTGLAREWRRDNDRHEWLRLFGIVTVLAGGLGLLGMLSVAVLKALASARAILPQWFPSMPLDPFQPSFGALMTGLSVLISAIGLKGFLEDYVGDVQQYAAYEETDKLYLRRRAVLESAERQLRHVLADPSCERVVVVAHSLGTAVAVDTLLELSRSNRASGTDDPLEGPIPLYKIEHLITYGSPVDKINYFFAVVQSRSASYEQLAEDLRGDIGTPPFSKVGRQPHLHWINFWDKGDIISGSLETVASSHLRGQEVDNVRVSTFVLPDLMGSHGAYAERPDVLKVLLDVILFRSYSYVEPPRDPQGRPDLKSLRQGPGKGSAAQDTLFTFVFLLPWLLLLGAIEIAFFSRSLAVRWALAVVVAVHCLGLVVHKAGARAGHRTPRLGASRRPNGSRA
jgi:hypothetical protein